MEEYSMMQTWMHKNLYGGATILIAGRREGGKTYVAISMAQNAIEGRYRLGLPVVLITNIPFGCNMGGEMPIEAYPDKVYHEITFSGTLRRIGQIKKEYNNKVIIIWILDEAQGFMLSDMNGSKENLALTKFFGVARKFNLCTMLITPSFNNVTPRMRCFPEEEGKSGYCSCQLLKNRDAASRICGRNDPKSVTFHREEPDAKFSPMIVESGSWTKGLYNGSLRKGEYSYDTGSTATFSMGKNANGVPFNIEEFIDATSTGLSHELGDNIEKYFEKWDSMGLDDELPGEDPVIIRNREQCSRLNRMREKGVKWEIISYIEGEPISTLTSRLKNYNGSSSKENLVASNFANDENGVTGGLGYIQPNKEKGEVGPPSSQKGPTKGSQMEA